MKPLISLLALVALLPRADAATNTLSGAGGATLPGLSWATAANWSPAAVPGSNDNAVVAATGLVDIRGSAFGGASEIQDLAFTGASAVTLHNNSSSTPMVLSLNGGRGTGVPLISATGNVSRTIAGPGTHATPQTLGLRLKTNGSVDVAAGTLSISARISDDGTARQLTKTGAGTLVLSGRNSYAGGTVVSAGVLELNGASAGNGRIDGAVTVDSGAELRITGGDGTGLGYNSGNKVDSLIINGGLVSATGTCHVWKATVTMTGGELRSNGGVSSPAGTAFDWGDTVVNTFASSNTSIIAGRINLRADVNSANGSLLTLNVADGPTETDLLISAALTQSGRPIGSTTGGSCGLVKKGEGTLRLTGAVQLTGFISVEAGTLDLATTSLTTNARINVAEGAQLKLPAGTNAVRNVFFEDVKLSAGRWGALGSVAAGLADFETAVITGPGVLHVADTGPSARERWKRMKYGQFTHYVYFGVMPDGTSFNNGDFAGNNFDAPGFADDLASMGVEYVIFTAWHANFVPMFNSAAVLRSLGFTRNTSRDVVGDMVAAVRARGIRVILYAHPNQPVIYNYTGHNDMLNDCYGEMLDRYGDQIDGFWLDENDPGGNQDGSVDFPRLERTIRRRNPDVVLIQNNYGNLYSADVGTSEWGPGGANFSPDIGYASVSSAARPMAPNWSVSVSTNSYASRASAEGIFRATVVAAASCIEGGGIGWAAGPYPGGGWEQGVLETMQGAGALMAPVAISITNTYPSTSWPVSSGFMGNVDINGAVATRSTDDAKEYVHVLYPPGGNTLTLPPPADGKVFGSARLLANGEPVTFSQTAGGVQLTLTGTNTWSTTDTVIELNVICRGGLGLVNNASAAIRYDGRSWAHLPNRGLGEFQNDVHAATADGDSFTFYFDGTDVELISSRSADRGLVDFYVDGVFQATVNLALNPTNRATVFALSGLARGPHTLRGVKRGGAALVVDAFKATEWIDSEDPDVSYQALTFFNNTDTASNGVGYIEYDGNWQWQQRDRNEYNYDAHWAQANGSTFRIHFNGTGVQFIGTYDGIIDFYIDDVFVKQVNMRNIGGMARVLGIDVKGLPAGWHTLKGVKVGDTYALVDAFFIYNEQNSSWSTQADGRAAGGTWRRSSAFGDVATLKFNGVGIDVIAPHSRSGGTVAVDVEGVSGRLVNQYAGTTQHQSLSYSSLDMMRLSPGNHLLGMSHNRSFGSIAVDAFRIHKDAAPIASAPLVPAGSVWKFSDTGANLGPAWRSNAFNDAAWPSGPAMLGYGDANGTAPRTVNSFGPDPNNKYITTYYRHAFTVANPAAFVGLNLRVRRDDGAVVYLNGVEVFRSNMPTGAVNSLTLASASVNGSDETRFFTIEVSLGLLRAGTNVLAAEIHQATADSSDLAFDLELVPTKAFEADFLPAGSSWRYNDTGANLGDSWRDTNYNDSAWPAGNAQLGFGDGDETTVVATNRHITTYFRRWVQIPNPADYAFTLWLLRDDGAVVYLNGAEVFRSNMPTGAVNHLTLAASAALPADETTTYYTTDLPASQLVPGWNLLAVEVHQSSTNSSDLSFDLALTASPLPPIPGLNIASAGSALTFAWPDWAGAFALHTATNLTPPAIWTPATNEPALLDNQWSVTLPVATNGQRFFRLQMP
jgi:autotransporter-associated beta strand protein